MTPDTLWREGRPVVLFDGVCNLCNGTVDFLIRRDRHGRLLYASLQGNTGKALLRLAGQPASMPENIVLVEGGRIRHKSDAALGIASLLPPPWPLLAALRIVPRPLRDLVYDWIARNRYAWFGKRDHCRLPTPAERAVLLD